MADLLSPLSVQVLHILEVRCASYDVWKAKYESDLDFGGIWAALQNLMVINRSPFLDYAIRNGWLYKFNLLCVS
jgi:hypothetical protein